MRVGIDIVQAHPDAERAELASEIEKFGADLALLPAASGVFQIGPIGGGVLGNYKQFLDARRHQPLGFTQNVGGGSRY